MSNFFFEGEAESTFDFSINATPDDTQNVFDAVPSFEHMPWGEGTLPTDNVNDEGPAKPWYPAKPKGDEVPDMSVDDDGLFLM
ncbi:MAG: hypothetical protein AAF318_16230 [Pseudomonadota bacterium]